MDYKKFGRKLKELRVAQDMSQQTLADILGVGLKQIQRYEAGSLLPPHETLNALIQEFDYDFLSLIYDYKKSQVGETGGSDFAKLLDALVQKENAILVLSAKSESKMEQALAEKEARLRELQEHKQDWKDQNKELMNLMKAQLNTLAGSVSLAHKEILTEIKASMRWEARRLAGGDKKKEKEILAELGTIVGAVRDEFWPKGNVEAGSM